MSITYQMILDFYKNLHEWFIWYKFTRHSLTIKFKKYVSSKTTLNGVTLV